MKGRGAVHPARAEDLERQQPLPAEFCEELAEIQREEKAALARDLTLVLNLQFRQPIVSEPGGMNWEDSALAGGERQGELF